MISSDDIKKLASLARINVPEADEAKLAADMQNILGYVEQIQHVAGGRDSAKKEKERVRNVLREDKNPHASGMHTDALVAEFPQKEGKYLKVKKIL